MKVATSPSFLYVQLCLFICFDDFGLAVERADFGGEGVEVMEAAVVGVSRHAFDWRHVIDAPWCENQQAAVSAGIESLSFGLPIGIYRVFLDMDERVSLFQAFVFHHQFAPRDARRDNHRGTLDDGIHPLPVLLCIVAGGLVRFPAIGMHAVALHLHLACPPQQEEIAKGAVVAFSNPDMKATLHQLWQCAAQNGAARVVVDVGDHGLLVSLVDAHGVVVIVIEQGPMHPAHQCVVFLALPLGHGADEGALVVVVAGFLAQPCRCLLAGALDRYRAIKGMTMPLLLLPVAGAHRLECLHDISQAPLHGFQHFNHPMEMVGHADASVYSHTIAMNLLFLGYDFPQLLDHFTQRRERDAGV